MMVWVPEGGAERVRSLARSGGATQALSVAAHDDDGPVDLLLLHVPNQAVEGLVGALSDVRGTHVSMFPQGVLALEPPPEEAPEQVLDVTLRSPLEIFLSGLQSIGSWTGFLAYAASAGAVVWVGLFTNTIYLLTAAMLIAPFAGPAMNAALATARGDVVLLRRSLVRYIAGLTVAGAVASLFALLFDQAVATSLMVQTSSVSTAAVVLPLAAGAAGAINLSQSDRSSLVSGAATGMLVAAALAPPVGVVGIATVLGDWPLVRSGVFLLALQLAGINLAGAAVFRLVGLRAQGARYPRGKRSASAAFAGATVVLLAALLGWQFFNSPTLQRSTIAQRAVAEVQRTVADAPNATLIEAAARFPRGDVAGQNTLLVTAHVLPVDGADAAALDDRVTRFIEDALLDMFTDVTPLVDVTLLPEPASPVAPD